MRVYHPQPGDPLRQQQLIINRFHFHYRDSVRTGALDNSGTVRSNARQKNKKLSLDVRLFSLELIDLLPLHRLRHLFFIHFSQERNKRKTLRLTSFPFFQLIQSRLLLLLLLLCLPAASWEPLGHGCRECQAGRAADGAGEGE